ncbi:hypothetical protein KGY73_09090 [bacterium]|nr:hypothetical protein [bacterium]
MKKISVWIFVSAFILCLGISCTQKEEKPESEALPDLSVQDVACMGEDLYLTLENQGQGSLPESWTSLASLYINGTRQADIILGQPTSVTRGGIKKPGGMSHYLIPHDISNPIRVDVYVDYNNKIEESHEENNALENIYIGPCLLPDLSIEEIYLNEECEVVVVIENKGPGRIPENIWALEQEPECTLSIFVNEEKQVQVKAKDFDPRQDLHPTLGKAAFTSGVKISGEESTVAATIDCSGIIKEQNEDNNTKSVMLSCKES